MNNFNNNSNFNANDRNINNNNRVRGIAQNSAEILVLTNHHRDLWKELCSYENLIEAFKKARKHKTLKSYVQEFEKNLKENLLQLRMELIFYSYKPKPLETFILHDPKTRVISKSAFRDRIIHHALCNIIEYPFEKSFIYDSYSNRKGKGVLKAIQRFDTFKNKVSENKQKRIFILKADISHYFDTVDHAVLLGTVKKKVKDKKIIWLIKQILNNYHTSPGKGMPLGNLTSQFFANVYLNDLDQYVKHKLKVKCYIRYVDDFVILNSSESFLEDVKKKIEEYTSNSLLLKLHKEKTKIIPLNRGVGFLGFKIFMYHRLLKKKNKRKFLRKMRELEGMYLKNKVSYDQIYDSLEGWLAHAKHTNTFKLRQKILEIFENAYSSEISAKKVNRYLRNRESFS